MRIAVLSDTHLGEDQTLPSWVWEQCYGVDLIIHAGDVVCQSLLSDLNQLAPLEVVQGNCDGWELANLPEKKIITCGEILIGITHGAYGTGRSTTERALRTFDQDKVDLIIFGHSHIPYLEKLGEILLFNPGSPTDKRRQPMFSMGMINIEDKRIRAEHLYSDTR